MLLKQLKKKRESLTCFANKFCSFNKNQVNIWIIKDYVKLLFQ